MKHHQYVLGALALGVAGVVLGALVAHSFSPPANKAEAAEVAPEPPIAPASALTHKQEVWISALEWCESRGNQKAINAKDRDGTPSYYSFQFKPGTFLSYAKAYHLIPANTKLANIQPLMQNYTIEHSVLERMVLDKSISLSTWRYSLFPDCIQNKIGNPPLSP
jgi:hypothetical protein